MARLFILSICLLWFSLPSIAQDYNAGLKAIQSGDFATALENWRPLAIQGNANAQHDLGIMYYVGEGVEKDAAEAARWYQLAAEQGHASAQYSLGTLYAIGEGVEKSDAKALHWYRSAAEQGVAKAQFNLANFYTQGKGVPKDHAEAARWYRLAAEQGIARSQYSLGVSYFGGYGVKKDTREAIKWFELAAEQGNIEAQYNLGIIYTDSSPKDYKKAAIYYRMAAEQGFANAQFNLATMYVSGNGTPKDLKLALSWAEKAAAQGVEPAQKLAAKLKQPTINSKRAAELSGTDTKYQEKIGGYSGYPDHGDLTAAIQKIAVVRGLNVVSLKINNCYLKKNGKTFLCNITTKYGSNNPISGLAAGLLNLEQAVWFDFEKSANGWHHVKSYYSCKIGNGKANCEVLK